MTGAGIQTQDGGGSVLVGSSNDGDKWLKMGHFFFLFFSFKEEPKGFADGLEGGCKYIPK